MLPIILGDFVFLIFSFLKSAKGCPPAKIKYTIFRIRTNCQTVGVRSYSRVVEPLMGEYWKSGLVYKPDQKQDFVFRNRIRRVNSVYF